MTVGVVLEVPGGSQEQYEQVIAAAFPGDKLPEGWVVHIAGPTPRGWRVINVVPSKDDFEAFARETLAAALSGADDNPPEVTFFPIYKLIEG
jgi:hypothetical protein